MTERRFAARWLGIEKRTAFLRFVPNLLRLMVWIGRWLGKEGQGACFEDMGATSPSKTLKTAHRGLKRVSRIAQEALTGARDRGNPISIYALKMSLSIHVLSQDACHADFIAAGHVEDDMLFVFNPAELWRKFGRWAAEQWVLQEAF